MEKFNISDYQKLINENIEQYVPLCEYGIDTVSDAMKYSLSIGGKRIRPILVLEFCRVCGGNIYDAIPFAVALEMIHTYSLIHDDLPCMDDDDMRRGMPSCHVKFGEANALLAGDALLTAAFGVISESRIAEVRPSVAVKAIRVLSRLAGVGGMIGGQELDLKSENKAITIAELETIDKLKTGALIKCAAALGVMCACDNENYMEAACTYAGNIGHAFQIVDDILDVVGDEKELGKPILSDEASGKSTYVSLLGLEKSKEIADMLTNEAIKALSVFGNEGVFLKELALSLVKRKK